MWPFRKAAPIPARKSASFLFSLGKSKAGLTSADYDKLAQEGYAECVVAFACINKIASAVASVEPQLYSQKNGKVKKLETHPLLDLLDRPNPAQSGMEFMLELTAYHRLAGNAYVFANGADGKQPKELQLLNPGKVKVEPGKGLFPQFFEHKPDANTRNVYPVDQVTGRSAVLQLKSFHPLNAWYGMSPLAAAALPVDIHSGGQVWNKRLIENGARPSGALVVKESDGTAATLTEEQYLRVKQMIDEQFSGAANAGRPLLLEGGLDWREMSINPKDMEFLNGKHSAARDIALAFGVPPQLLGIPGDNTYANYEEAKLAFWTETVIPLLCWYLAGLNRWLTPLYGQGMYLWYDEEMIPALEPLRKAKADRINASNTMTINEKRRAMGHDDLPNGIGDVLVLEGRGVLLGMDGSIIALATNVNTDPGQDPLIDPTATQPDPAKHKTWLIANGYSEERAERLTKLVYG